MKLPRRKFLHLAAGAAALPILPYIANAQTYPARPVRIVVTFTAGGANDIHARLFGQLLSERLGQSFVVENRPGGGGNIGTLEVVRSAPDGYTLLLISVGLSINAAVYEKLPYDLVRDIAPIAAFFHSHYVMVGAGDVCDHDRRASTHSRGTASRLGCHVENAFNRFTRHSAGGRLRARLRAQVVGWNGGAPEDACCRHRPSEQGDQCRAHAAGYQVEV